MRRILFYLCVPACSWLSWGAVSSVQVGDSARQQAVVSFRVANPSQCTVAVYRDAALTSKVDDTNNLVFGGSELCNRPYNLVNGNDVTAVIGRRTSETALDGKLHSRSLEVSRTYYMVITDLTDMNVARANFTTDNIPWGDTHIEDVPFNLAGFNHWAYPDLDWSDAGRNKEYVDPLSGVAFKRVTRQMSGGGGTWGNNLNDTFQFEGVIDAQAAWTNASRALSNSQSGPFASYAGSSRAPLFLSFRHDGPGADLAIGNYIPEDMGIQISGYAASTGNVEDSKILVCLGMKYNPATDQCANEIEVTLPGSAATVTAPSSFPSYGFGGWNLGRFPALDELTVQSGNATVSNSAVTLTSGWLPVFAAPGMKINIDGNWYTIGGLGTATSFTLAESNVNASGAWSLGAFGVRIRKKTTVSNQINIAAVYQVAHSNKPGAPSNGQPDYCSALTFSVAYEADGTTPVSPPRQGRLCMSGPEPLKYLFLLTEDGESRYLAPLTHIDSSYTGMGVSMPLTSFSTTDPFSLTAVHTDDSGPLGADERKNSVFYRVTYNPSACHFRAWTGNGYLSVATPPDTCVTWTNLTPYTAGRTINQQIAAGIASNPIWNSSWTTDFSLGAFSGKYALLYKVPNGQNNPCFVAVFDTTDYSLVKVFDSFSGSLPGFRWGGCHSYGADVTDGHGWAAFAFSQLTARNVSGWLAGPFVMQGITAKSLDGGNTWLTDTSLNSGTLIATATSAGKCGTNPVVIGSQCVDLTNTAGECTTNAAGITGPQCVWFKIRGDTACNVNADSRDSSRWPCSWHSGWSSGGMTIREGDYFARITDDSGAIAPDGKREKFRILNKVADGTGWKIQAQRWSTCDNITSDFKTGAVMYSDHLFTGYTSAAAANGWNGAMMPTAGCAGAETWINLGLPLAQTVIALDSSELTTGHNTIGIGPDGVQLTQAGGAWSRTGTIPSMLGQPAQIYNELLVSRFNGTVMNVNSNGAESYPSLSNWTAGTVQRRSLFWDWRHINPDNGTNPEDVIGMWSHTYTRITGQVSTYKMDIHGDLVNHKLWRPSVFATRSAFKDISGPGSLIDDTKPWTYCYAYKAGECRPGASANDLYVVAPNANIGLGGCTTDTYRSYTPCAASLWHFAGWMVEGSTQINDYLGNHQRRITMGLTGPAAQYQYTSPHMVSDGSWALVKAGWPNGVRYDLLAVKMPPPAATDNIDRLNAIPIPVSLGSGSGYARIRFGYAENGPATAFYCTSRQEACLTDANLAPFAFEQSDTRAAVDCRAGCTITIPALSGRVVYYRVEKSADGVSGWVSGSVQARAVK